MTARSGLRQLLLALMCAGAGLQAQAGVGLARLMVGELPVTLVYPTDAAEAPLALGPFVLTVAADAVPSAGLRRLVVLSHGTGGSPTSDHDLAATLARAGFVVAQPLHAGDNHRSAIDAGPVSWARRPGEVSRVIDALSQHPDWGPRLQLDRVGVHGMSAGGVTALALAGAQWSTLQMVRHCRAHGGDDAGFCLSGATDGASRAARQALYDSAGAAPEALLPASVKAWHGGRGSAAGENPDPRPDARVAAVTLSVPVAAIFSADSLARIRVPVGILRAGRDQWLPPRFHADWVLAACQACTVLARLEGAGHVDLLSPWPDGPARELATRQWRGGAPEAGFNPAERSAAFEAVARFFALQLQP